MVIAATSVHAQTTRAGHVSGAAAIHALAALSVPGLRKLISMPRALSVSATVIKGIVLVRIKPLEEAANDIAATVT